MIKIFRMKVTVTTLNDEIFVLDVCEDIELENFIAFCEIESGVPANEILILFNGKPLLDHKVSLRQHGIRNQDVVIMQRIHQSENKENRSSKNGWYYSFLLLWWYLYFIFGTFSFGFEYYASEYTLGYGNPDHFLFFLSVHRAQSF